MSNGSVFRTPIAETVFNQKYRHEGAETWERLCATLVEDVCGKYMSVSEKAQLVRYMQEMKFIPGGRYLYYAGRPAKYFSNCFMLRAETDTRQDWADLSWKSESCLMTGGGIGVDYSVYREKGAPLGRTGGTASGPIPKMQMINEIGRHVMQGGSRRCLPATTVVRMADNTSVSVAAVKVGDFVATRHGPRRVSAVASQGVQDLIHVTTPYGSVTSSRGHKWLTADKTRRKRWMLADSLCLGNKLYYMPEKTVGGDDLNTDFAYMLGFYLGNGCAYSSDRTHEVTFQFADKHVTDAQIARVIRGVAYITADHNPVCRPGHGKCTELRVRGKDLVPIFQKWKAPNTPFSVPTEVLTANIEARAAFVAGWMDADGYFGEDAWKLSNKYATTRAEFRALVRSMGLLTTEQSGGEVRFCGFQHAAVFALLKPYSVKVPSSFTHNTSEVPAVITKVESLPAEETFDIQVEEVEEFIADNFVTHNSAIYASLNWRHPDAADFIAAKDWHHMSIPGTDKTIWDVKQHDFNYAAPLDMTNISLNYDNAFLAYVEAGNMPPTFVKNVRQALSTGEPGFSFNFGEKENETLRNACCELVSEDDSDICNIGSLNLARIENKQELADVTTLATYFLLCGTMTGDVPYEKVRKVREKNRRLGLGIMGVHEWLIQRGQRYEVVPELHQWLRIYQTQSDRAADRYAQQLSVTRPAGVRAVAPTGTIGMLASTTTGVEPLFAVAYQRRYLKGTQWHYQYVIDGAAQHTIETYGTDPEKIESAIDLAADPERRVKFQADVQQYVDHAISSTLNLPQWGSALNNEDKVEDFAKMFAKYAPRLRGLTVYPEASRGGQPLTPMDYHEAKADLGTEFVEHDICLIGGKGGTCGI